MPHSLSYWFSTVLTFARREAKELLRDKIRLFFAALGPAIMLAAVGWAISFDVNNLKFSVLDRDQTIESRRVIEYFRGSPYFKEQAPVYSLPEAEARLKRNQVVLVIDIPPDFGRSLAQGKQPEIGFYIDGTIPFNASNIQAYAQSMVQRYNMDTLKARGMELPKAAAVVPRFLYNQDFKSMNAIVPNVLMMVLTMIPAIMTALSVVREREIGSIANLYASPASVPQYLMGKQLPYLAMGVFNFVSLTLMIVFWFGVPLKGSLLALFIGTLLHVAAATAFGLLISAFTKSQTAAFFISAIGSVTIASNFSGMMYPVSTMSGVCDWRKFSRVVVSARVHRRLYQRLGLAGFWQGICHAGDVCHRVFNAGVFEFAKAREVGSLKPLQNLQPMERQRLADIVSNQLKLH